MVLSPARGGEDTRTRGKVKGRVRGRVSVVGFADVEG
jgi:hypothetical protein